MTDETAPSPRQPVGRVFISYRRNDSGYVAQTIRDRLVREFGTDAVFMDIDDIPLGVNFRRHVADALAECRLVLALIGDQWTGPQADGARRIDDPRDLVRVELETGLGLGIPVIPVLVGHASMPAPPALPESLRDIADMNAAEVRSGKFLGLHLDNLVAGITPYLLPPPAASPAPHAAPAASAPAAADATVAQNDGTRRIGNDGGAASAAPASRPSTHGRRALVPMAAGVLGIVGFVVFRALTATDSSGEATSVATPASSPASGGGNTGAAGGAGSPAEFEQRRAAARATLRPILKQLGDEGLKAGGVFNIAKRWPPGTVVQVCFMDGTKAERARVARVASEWTLYANIGLDFGDWNDPRRCPRGQDTTAPVRVAFKTNGNWSFVGKDALTAGTRGDPTLGLQSAAEPQCSADLKFCDQAILHEFGHVLGFDHAWTSPQGDCQQEMNWDFIYQDAATVYGWSRQQVDEYLRPSPSSGQLRGEFDRRSVMNYELPDKWFKKGKGSKCFLLPLGELSLRDKLAALTFLP